MSATLPRRELFVGGGLLLGLGSVTGPAEAQPRAEGRLAELGIELPPPPEPMATYTTRVEVGELLFVSGHGPFAGTVGKLGRDLDVEAGQKAARETALNVLATVRDALGTLDRVVRVVQIVGMVNCTSDFVEQPQVVNGFSDLLVEIFGDELGRGARAAVGMVSLPAGIPVEIQAIFQIRS